MVDAECLADSKSTHISEIGAKLRTHEAFKVLAFFHKHCYFGFHLLITSLSFILDKVEFEVLSMRQKPNLLFKGFEILKHF